MRSVERGPLRPRSLVTRSLVVNRSFVAGEFPRGSDKGNASLNYKSDLSTYFGSLYFAKFLSFLKKKIMAADVPIWNISINIKAENKTCKISLFYNSL